MDSVSPGLMDKVGIERRLLTAGANKVSLDPSVLKPSSNGFTLWACWKEIHDQFITVVRTEPWKAPERTPDMFSGLFWSGQQAVQLGFGRWFGPGGLCGAGCEKAEEIVDYTRRDNVAERLVKRFGAALAEATVRAVVVNGAKIH